MKDKELIPRLEKLSDNLLWMSESDYPFQVFLWENTEIIIPEQIKKITNSAEQAAIEIISVNDFFEPALKLRSYQNAGDRTKIRKYQNLVNFLKTNLKDIKVYRIGSIEIDVYIIGKTESGNLAVLATKVIET